MQAGVLATLNAPNETLDTLYGETNQDGTRYRHCIEPRMTLDPSRIAGMIQVGQAAMEVPEETDSVSIRGESIDRETTVTTTTKYTEWILIPGEMLIIQNGDGRFLFELLASELGWDANRVRLDLTSMASEYSETQIWQAGFYDHVGTAQKGVVYGDNVVSDQDIGSALDESRINQLGLRYEYNDDSLKVTLTESGYVEVYQPSEYESTGFANYIEDEVQRFVAGIYTE